MAAISSIIVAPCNFIYNKEKEGKGEDLANTALKMLHVFAFLMASTGRFIIMNMKLKFSETTKGILLLILSAFFFALMAVFVRLSGDIFFVQKAFFRNIVAFVIALAGILIDIKKHGYQVAVVPKGAFIYLLLRAITGSIGIFGNAKDETESPKLL